MSKKNHTPQASPDQVGWPLIQSFQSELNRMFDRFNATSWGADHKVMPVLDIAEIPGMKQEDLDVSISDETLILKGTKSDAREGRTKDWHRIERSFGAFRRHVPLGFAPKDGKIDATFKGGVLTLRIAKPADVAGSARKIDIAHA